MTWARVAAVATAALVLTGCSWRLDTEPEPFRTPSATTVLRDHVAAAEAAVASAAAASADPLAAVEVEAAPIRLAALGGVSPTSSPRPSTSLAEALDESDAATSACMEGAGDDPLGGLCASIALSHELIGAASGRDAWKQFSYLAAPVTLPPADTAVSTDVLAQLALAHDKLRALYEVVAARSEGDARDAALERSAAERARTADLLAIDGVADLTEPTYDVPNDADAALRQNLGLAQEYAALMVAAAPQDRAWLLNAAAAAYGGAFSAGLTAAEVPALPGAVEPTAAEPAPGPS